jgi:hypothetical protein
MPYVSQILSSSLFKNIVDLSFNVKVTQFLEAEFPELWVCAWIHSCVIAAEVCSSIVAQPNIEAIPYHLKRRRHVWVVYYPSGRTAQYSVLKEDSWRTFLCEVIASYMVDCQNVAIVSLRVMFFKYETLIFNNFFQRLIVLGRERPGPVARGAPVNGTIWILAHTLQLLVFLSKENLPTLALDIVLEAP